MLGNFAVGNSLASAVPAKRCCVGVTSLLRFRLRRGRQTSEEALRFVEAFFVPHINDDDYCTALYSRKTYSNVCERQTLLLGSPIEFAACLLTRSTLLQVLLRTEYLYWC